MGIPSLSGHKEVVMFQEGTRKFWMTIAALASYTLIHIFVSPEAAEQSWKVIAVLYGGGVTSNLVERKMKTPK